MEACSVATVAGKRLQRRRKRKANWLFCQRTAALYARAGCSAVQVAHAQLPRSFQHFPLQPTLTRASESPSGDVDCNLRLLARIAHASSSESTSRSPTVGACLKLRVGRFAPFASLTNRTAFTGWTNSGDEAQSSAFDARSGTQGLGRGPRETSEGGAEAYSTVEHRGRQYSVTAQSTSIGTSAGQPTLELSISQPGKKYRYTQPQNRPADPWTPTQQLKKRKTLPKRMGFMMQVLEKEQAQKLQQQSKHPDFVAGNVLELKLAVPENKGRLSTFRGVCIGRRNRGIRTSFTLRNHMGSVGAVERSFPLYSPTIQSIRILQRRRVRRAKLYYLRDRNPKECSIA